MTDSDDAWPLPSYDAGPKDMVHAIGVISIQYNQLENAMFGLYRHHLELAQPFDTIVETYFRLREGDRVKKIRSVFAQHETDHSVKRNVERLIDYFDICAKNRNILMHCLSEGRSPDLFIKKRLKGDWSTVSYTMLSRETLRRVADDMFRGFNLVFDVFYFIQNRDRKLPWFMLAAQRPALPDEFGMPFELTLDGG